MGGNGHYPNDDDDDTPETPDDAWMGVQLPLLVILVLILYY